MPGKTGLRPTLRHDKIRLLRNFGRLHEVPLAQADAMIECGTETGSIPETPPLASQIQRENYGECWTFPESRLRSRTSQSLRRDDRFAM